MEAFGKCGYPRVAEATSLVSKLESDGIVRENNIRILTALIQVHGASGDLNGAQNTFSRIQKPDIASVNAFLTACFSCEADDVAKGVFDSHLRSPESRLRPDAISYSIMISMQMRKGQAKALKRARLLYEEMKFQQRLAPDKTLVDM